jgi:DNA-binding GntR family transcriptional regulator
MYLTALACALVEETGLSRSTVQKTLKALRDSGEVYSVQGLGTFVSPKD